MARHSTIPSPKTRAMCSWAAECRNTRPWRVTGWWSGRISLSSGISHGQNTKQIGKASNLLFQDETVYSNPSFLDSFLCVLFLKSFKSLNSPEDLDWDSHPRSPWLHQGIKKRHTKPWRPWLIGGGKNSHSVESWVNFTIFHHSLHQKMPLLST